MAFAAHASLLNTSDMTIITGDATIVQPVQPTQSQEAQDYSEALVKERNLRRELEKDVNWLFGEPCMIIEGLRAHEERTKAQEQIAIRVGESRQTPSNGEILIQEQKENKELWTKAIEDWREWLGQGRKGIKSSKALVLCHERILELRIKLQQELGSSTEATKKYRQTYMELSISTVHIDTSILQSEKMFMECEDTFREWGRQPLLKRAEISKENHDKNECTDEGRSMEEERRSLEDAKRIVEEEKRGVEEERRILEKERQSMEEEMRMVEAEIREERRRLEDRRMADADRRGMEDKIRILREERRFISLTRILSSCGFSG